MEWRHFVFAMWLGILLLGRLTASIRNSGSSIFIRGAPTLERDPSLSAAHSSSRHVWGSAAHLHNVASAIGQQQQDSPAAAAWLGPLGSSSTTPQGSHSASRVLKQTSTAPRSNSARRQQRRNLAQRGSVPLWDMPGDPTADNVVLQSLDPLVALLPFSPYGTILVEPPVGPADIGSGSSDGTSVRDFNYQSKGSAQLSIDVVFVSVANFNNSLRLPLPPRHFYVALTGSDSANTTRGSCGDVYVYKDQAIDCPGLVAGKYTVALFDADDENLLLGEEDIAVPAEGASAQVQVQLGMLVLEASFGSLAWASQFYPQRKTETGPVAVHAQIVGAQIVVYSQARPGLLWDMQWTGDEGTAYFFLLPNSQQFIANMSVGDTLLASKQVSFSNSLDGASLALEPQLLQLTAEPQLLCTGEVEDVRGESGQFPANLTAEDGSQPLIYHPRGFFCRWELLPDYPELTLTVNYANLLEHESITLYLGPNNVVRLQRPLEPRAGGIFQTSIWVDRSIFVEFQTTRDSTHEVGSFSVSWASSSPGKRSLMDSRTMVVVLACVSAAGAVLAAFCFFCMCCGRRRRGAVVVDGTAAAQHVNLLRVPSAVRELLPSKPYQPPEADNPLPGAATEPDCCSICLVEFEAQEHVTVLPCMHFYHKGCIDSWLNRNCTCPLCKANVLQAFSHANGLPLGQLRRSRRHRRRQHQASAADATTAGNNGGDGSSSSSGSSSPGQAVNDVAAVTVAAASGVPWATAAGVELAHAASMPAGGSMSAWQTSPAQEQQQAARVPAAGDAIVDVRALPTSPADGHGRLPALQPRVAHLGTAAGLGGSDIPKSSMHSCDGQHAAAGDSNCTGEQLSTAVGYPAAGTYGASMSLAASVGLQSGTVHASPSDFAAAAAAAALVSVGTGDFEGSLEHERSSSSVTAGARAVPAAGLASSTAYNGAVSSAAQASVAALRAPSRVWGQLHGWLRGSNGSIPDDSAAAGGGGGGGGGVAAAAAGDASTAVATPPVSNSWQLSAVEMHAMAGNSGTGAPAGAGGHANSSGRAARPPELLSSSLPGRVAVSIYAYAGHPQPADVMQEAEDVAVIDIGDEAQQLQQHWQRGLQHEGVQEQQRGMQAAQGHGMRQAASSSYTADRDTPHTSGRCNLPGATQ